MHDSVGTRLVVSTSLALCCLMPTDKPTVQGTAKTFAQRHDGEGDKCHQNVVEVPAGAFPAHVRPGAILFIESCEDETGIRDRVRA